MIDEKGRLFGKINIIDLFVLVVLIAAIIFAVFKFVLPKDNVEEVPTQNMDLILNCQSTPFFTADKLVKGAEVYDGDSKVVLGTLESFEFFPYYENQTASDYFISVILHVNSNGSFVTRGVEIGGRLYGSGHTMVCYFNDAKLYVKVQDYKAK